jgi:hypothetical protein
LRTPLLAFLDRPIFKLDEFCFSPWHASIPYVSNLFHAINFFFSLVWVLLE